jgi:broad specificity phosphatase PhoE
MIEKELYIIRHGQTDHNAKGIVQGKGVNLSLNETGRRQAGAFFEAYKHVQFDIAYSSSLKRAQESIAQFAALGIPHESYAELDEISWGDFEGSNLTSESDGVFQALLQKWREGDIHAKPSPSGESPLELQQRQKVFLKHLLSTPHKKILIATHGRFIRSFMCTLTEKPLSRMEDFTHVNLCLYKVNLLNNGKFEIELNCEQSHLQGIR